MLEAVAKLELGLGRKAAVLNLLALVVPLAAALEVVPLVVLVVPLAAALEVVPLVVLVVPPGCSEMLLLQLPVIQCMHEKHVLARDHSYQQSLAPINAK